MGYNLNNKIIEPCLYSCDSIITEVNKEFIDLTGFTIDELLGKSLTEIGDMIKINLQILIDNIESKYSGYIFTKILESREVNISLSHGKETNEEVYTFVEKLHSRLNDKLIFEEQTFIDNVSGVAVYSVPDLILLKVNQKYLNFMDSPFNIERNSIGRPIREIITEFVGSKAEVTWNTVLETQKTSFIKEFKFDKFVRGITYWDTSKKTIFENGKMKYIFDTVTEVTERVLINQRVERQNKIIQNQREQLEQHNTQLTSVIKNLSEGVMILDNKGKLIMENLEAKKLTYQSDKVIVIDDSLENIKLLDMKGNKIPLENFPVVRALRGEKVKNAKMIISHPNKEYFAEISSFPIYNTNGDLNIIVLSFHDITETIEQSKKIEEQKKEVEAIIENIADGISIFDNKGQYILSNKSARDMFFPSCKYMDKTGEGYNESEIYDIDGDKIDRENIPALRVMRDEKFKNMRMAVKFPHKTLQIDVSGTPIYDSEGKFTLGVLCSRDMTDYFNHEEALRGRYEFLNKMVDTFGLSLIRLSCPDLKIVDINKQAFSMIKLLSPNVKSIKQIKDNDIKGLFKLLKPNEYYQCITEVLKEKETKYLNKQKHLIDGNEIYWNVIFEPIIEVNGEIQEILIITIDITDEIKSNTITEKTLKSQEEFLVNISHELKTPLNVICTAVQLFNMYCNNGSLDERKNSIIKYMDSIKQNSYRLSKIINNIVDLSRIDAGFFELNLSNNNIIEVVEAIVMPVINFTKSKGKCINIIFDTDIEEKIIACDPEKIERIVLNLLSNAIKFSGSVQSNEISVDVKDKNEFVEISVKDTGIGIEDKYLNIIFDIFKQVDKSLSRNSEGVGIGLSLVKSITELHGGSVHVESEFGKGSKFTIILPSRKVSHENRDNSEFKNTNESIQVEFSDILFS